MDRKDQSGTGKPGTNGWEWEANPKVGPELGKAFEMLDKKRPPSMVNLPLEIR
jgi:hypothetical protein